MYNHVHTYFFIIEHLQRIFLALICAFYYNILMTHYNILMTYEILKQ